MSLQVTFELHRGFAARFFLSGSLDSNTAPDFERRVDAALENSPDSLILDMSGLNFISSAGLRVIFKARKTMERRGGEVIMTHLKPQVAKVFEIVNALPSLSIFASTKELDDYLEAIQGKVAREAHDAHDGRDGREG